VGFVACKSTTPSQEKAPATAQWLFDGFEKVDSLNPILQPSTLEKFNCPITKQPIAWSGKNVLNPAAIVKNDTVYLLFRSQDSAMTSRLGIAVSSDGLHFTKMAQPVFYPDNDTMKKYEWKGGVEDPRLVEAEDGRYILTYTSYDGKTARLCLATSTDLLHWTKHGLVLSAPQYQQTWSKSGAIVAELHNGKMIAKKINGKYWMYFGDTQLFIASSTDLLHWEVLTDLESGKMTAVLHPRAGYFDSRLVEPGPYALYQNDGILLMYNSSNAANYNDTTLPKFTYSAGQALFSATKPYQLIDRAKHYFLTPDKPYEKTGEVNNVCFAEGLVQFKGKWFLYYGTADSRIAVAVKSLKPID
jgi:predicted GH43/DUF377 family glycosyl hydrolase